MLGVSQSEESAPEVACVGYRPGVYKASMVRMQVRDLPTNVRVYGSKCRHGRNAMTAKCGVRGVE